MRILYVLLSYGFKNQVRSRLIFTYALFYFAVGWALLQFGGDSKRAVASFLSIVILFNPAVAILYSTVHWYSASNFNHLILTQPIGRGSVVLSSWLSIVLGLTGSFAIGVTGAFLLAGALSRDMLHLLFAGAVLNAVFAALGILSAVTFHDRMKGVAASLGCWLYFSVVHDGIAFMVLLWLGNFPVERPAFAFMGLNPIDLARLYLLLQFDLAALMGYTGAILQKMAGSAWGVALLATGLAVWLAGPPLLLRSFYSRKDL